MSSQINIKKFANQVKSKRGTKGLREAANEIGEISASTLSRIEQGNIPDLDTFIRICKWLGLSPDYFTLQNNFENNRNKKIESTPAYVAAHLRADKTLAPETAQALIKMIELAYDAAQKGDFIEHQKG